MAPNPAVSASRPAAAASAATAHRETPADLLDLAIDEGIRQLHLVLIWIRYRGHLTRLRDAEKDKHAAGLADRLMKEVIAPSLGVEWLPGLDQVAHGYKASPEQYRGVAWDDWLSRVKSCLKRRVESAVAAGRTPSRKGLEALVQACRKGPEECGDLRFDGGQPFRLAPATVAAHWAVQAAALDAWFRLLPELLALESGYRFDKRLGFLANQALDLAARLKAAGQKESSDEAKRLGKSIEDYVTVVTSNLGTRAGFIPPLDRYEWQKVYDATPEAWPPRILAELAERLRHETGWPATGDEWLGRIRVAEPRDGDGSAATARELLALRLLDELDDASAHDSGTRCPPPPAAWALIGRELGALLGGEATLVRGQPLDPATQSGWRLKSPTGKPDSAWLLKRTGLVLDGRVPMRQALVEVPPDEASPLISPLTALRGLPGFGPLARLAEELYDLVKRAPRLEPQKLRGPADDVLIWRTLVRAHVAHSPQTALLVEELGRLGYRLEPAPRAGPAGEAVEPGWAIVLPNAVDRPELLAPATAPTADAVALRRPDGRLVLPAAWLRVPHPWQGREKWLDVLLRHEASLLRLTCREPGLDTAADWAASSGLADLVRALVAARTPATPAAAPPPEAGSHAAAALFRAFFDEAAAARRRAAAGRGGRDPSHPEELEAIARELYPALDEAARARLGIPLKDDLSPDLEKLVGGAGGDLELTWKEAPGQSNGPELVDLALAGEGGAARLVLRATRACDQRVLAWARLPDPGPGPPPELAAIRQALRWVPAYTDPGVMLARILSRLGQLLADDEKLGWLVRAGLAPGEGAAGARAWLQQILRERLVPIYPELDATTLQPRWPAGLPVRAPGEPASHGLAWDFDDEAESGRPIGPAGLKFSTEPARAGGRFSLGPHARRPWLAGAIDLAGWARSTPGPLGEALRGPAGRMAREAVEALRADPDRPPPADWPPLAEALAALLAAARPEMAAVCDAALGRLRAVADGLGVRLLPARWSFADPPAEGQVPAAEVLIEPGPEPAGFDPDHPAGRLILRRFGQDGSPARARVSCGPPPPQYPELRELLAALKHPGAARLLEMLAGWPASSRAGRIELEAVDFYLKFWDVLGGEFRRTSYDEFTAVEGRLAALLAGFDLIKFEPRTLDDVPESWVEIKAQGSLHTGRVRRVERPGLRTSRNELKVAAQVEVE
jgi:hypothetical protein